MDKLLNREIQELQDRVNNLENLWANTPACRPKPTEPDTDHWFDGDGEDEPLHEEPVEELLCGATLFTPDGKPITTITCTRPKSHTIRSPMVISHIHQSDTIRITWSDTETYSDGATPLTTPQNYEDNYSSTQTISEEAFARLTELLDADEEDEYTRSDKEQPTPQPGDIWARIATDGYTQTVLIHDVHSGYVLGTWAYYSQGDPSYTSPRESKAFAYDFSDEYTLVWRDGKRWDGA